jgi:hypothetical protein
VGLRKKLQLVDDDFCVAMMGSMRSQDGL